MSGVGCHNCQDDGLIPECPECGLKLKLDTLKTRADWIMNDMAQVVHNAETQAKVQAIRQAIARLEES